VEETGHGGRPAIVALFSLILLPWISFLFHMSLLSIDDGYGVKNELKGGYLKTGVFLHCIDPNIKLSNPIHNPLF
jgi:hypothetical protein